MIFGFSKAEKLTHEQRSAAGRFDVKESRFSIINESHHCVTLAASLAAQQGPTSMAAFQVCLQVCKTVDKIAMISAGGFIGIWVALTIYMGLRAFAGFLRIGTGSGPWEFLRSS
ncbi:hypothetical protein GYH30_050133 [Glycine max]|uniref:Uncharacterized protein n=1 Tax=Glycine max TaxID=3847 RepID=K7MSJ7_SOYBN|nr:hypothetical protein GYH30_050133 [Glycine max]